MKNQPERKSPIENLEHVSIRQYCKAVPHSGYRRQLRFPG
jgi:hypothetical protein